MATLDYYDNELVKFTRRYDAADVDTRLPGDARGFTEHSLFLLHQWKSESADHESHLERSPVPYSVVQL